MGVQKAWPENGKSLRFYIRMDLFELILSYFLIHNISQYKDMFGSRL